MMFLPCLVLSAHSDRARSLPQASVLTLSCPSSALLRLLCDEAGAPLTLGALVMLTHRPADWTVPVRHWFVDCLSQYYPHSAFWWQVLSFIL